MLLRRKSLLLGATALAALTMTAGQASAQIEVVGESGGSHCPQVTISVHHVEGGCHLRFRSTVDVTLHAHTPQKVTFSSCELILDGRIGEDGEGFVTQAILDPPHSGPTPCTRAACDEAAPSHALVPWPFHLGGYGTANAELEMELCLRTSASGEGGSGNWCHLVLDLADHGGHLLELGGLDSLGGPAEVSCENNPGTGYTGPHAVLPLPVSVEAHLQTDPAGDEDIEVTNWDPNPNPSPFEVYDESNGNAHCPAVVSSAHGATGGCHIEFAGVGDIPLHAYSPSKVTISNCQIDLEGVIDEGGDGYFTEMLLTPPNSGTLGCTRAACDEELAIDDHRDVPWPFRLIEHGAADEEFELELCTRHITAGEGGIRLWCELHFDFTALGGHQYQIGQAGGSGSGTEELCENSPGTGYTGPHPLASAPASFEAEFETTGTEEVGIVH